jgi:predicted ester cyclase
MRCAVLVVAAILFISCSSAPSPEEIEKRNMTVIREAHAALSRGDFESFAAAIGPGYVRHCQSMPPGQQELRGTEEFFTFLREFLVAVPQYEDTLSEMIADGDRVAYVSTMRGKQTGPLGDLPATNEEFTLVNIIIQRLEDEKIVETWVSWDNVAFLTQLGLMPSPEPAQ